MSIDFMLAFPQASLEPDVFMEIHQVFDHYYDGKSHVLKLKRSTHGLEQSNCNFYQKLKALKDRGTSPCKNDLCAHASRNLILVIHVEDVLIFSPKKLWIELFIKSLMDGSENFELTDEGNKDKFLSVEIRKHLD